MAEIKKTISQIKIGDSIYNIKDAEVREALGNVTDNFISLYTDYKSDWNTRQNLKTNAELKNANTSPEAVMDSRLAVGVSIDVFGHLRWRYASLTNNNKIIWVLSQITAGIPEKVSQCGIILQYRNRILMPIRGQVTASIFRLETSNSDLTEADSALPPTQTTGYIIQNSTAHTCAKSLDGAAVLHCSTSWYDRVVRSDKGRRGWDYKIGIHDYVHYDMNSNLSTKRAQYAGGCFRIFLIIQGTSTQALIPIEEETIPDNEPPADGQNENQSEGS